MEFLIKFHDIKLTFISNNMLKDPGLNKNNKTNQYKIDFDQIKFHWLSISLIWIVHFHQRLPDETFGEILSEEFKKQIIAVRHRDRID